MIVDAKGKPIETPAPKTSADPCPECGSDKSKRGPSGGFGVRRPLCIVCGHRWDDEIYRD